MMNMKKYNKKILLGLIGLIMLFSIFTSTQMLNSSNSSENNEISHDFDSENLFISASRGEIKIYNDSAFISANGVLSGSGTQGDPYLIYNWDINTPVSGFCIEIVNTSSYFEIINCSFSDGIAGVMLQNVTNGKVINNTFQDFSRAGVRAVNSKKTNITDNVISNIYGAEGLNGADGTTGDTPTSGGIGTDGEGVTGIYTSNSSFLYISYNKISDIYGGLGGSGGNGGDALPDAQWPMEANGADGANGGQGGSGIGIVVENSNHSVIFNNNIQNLFGGTGGSGGSGGHGSDMITVETWGGDGGVSGAGGRGGKVIGIYVDPSYNVSSYYNNISNLYGGSGGQAKTAGNGGLGNGWFAGGGSGGDGNEGGEGGSASGMLLDNIQGSINIQNIIY